MIHSPRFQELWLRAGGTTPDPAADALEAGYGEPHRAYHNWTHIGAMLTGLDTCRATLDFAGIDADVVELAIFFHDVVYDARAKDNEARSAALFAHLAREDGLDASLLKRVAAMIEATATHGSADDPSTRLLLDLDLQILGSAPEAYSRYVAAVRREYDFVADDAWRTGRAVVLRHFLERPVLFQTAYFQSRFEADARRNVASEIAALEAG